MLGLPLRYLLKHPVTTLRAMAADPLQVWLTARDYYASERESKGPQCGYVCDPQWEQRMHEALGLAGCGTTWPCAATAEFNALWAQVLRELEAKGIDPGPASFQWWNDGDAGMVRAVWCLVRHLRPKRVVETGVAHGLTSRFILEAMERNGTGHLWSIDLPPIEREWRAQVGAAVGDAAGTGRLGKRWTYLAGSSRRRLPGLLQELGAIDLFVHDSLHSARNVGFELERAWAAMPKGAVVVDDVDANWGFHRFTQGMAAEAWMIGEAELVRPDTREGHGTGMFGVVLKRD